LDDILTRHRLRLDQIAYIGDDTNDLPVMRRVGLTATPADGFTAVQASADYVCQANGGYGAFREFAECIIIARRLAVTEDACLETENGRSGVYSRPSEML
jgi:3-deoxy-D-manno-octulosonate 8-phosphate phosphatase (KDO 8-P phosphatase)